MVVSTACALAAGGVALHHGAKTVRHVGAPLESTRNLVAKEFTPRRGESTAIDDAPSRRELDQGSLSGTPDAWRHW